MTTPWAFLLLLFPLAVCSGGCTRHRGSGQSESAAATDVRLLHPTPRWWWAGSNGEETLSLDRWSLVRTDSMRYAAWFRSTYRRPQEGFESTGNRAFTEVLSRAEVDCGTREMRLLRARPRDAAGTELFDDTDTTEWISGASPSFAGALVAAVCQAVRHTPRSVRPLQVRYRPLGPPAGTGWELMDSTDLGTMWLNTSAIEGLGTDTLTVRTAVRFPSPHAGGPDSTGRLVAEGRYQHVIDCRGRRMRTGGWDTRDTTGAIVDSGRVHSEWLMPSTGSIYAIMIRDVCALAR